MALSQRVNLMSRIEDPELDLELRQLAFGSFFRKKASWK